MRDTVEGVASSVERGNGLSSDRRGGDSVNVASGATSRPIQVVMYLTICRYGKRPYYLPDYTRNTLRMS